jgi:hypothetical protein
MCTVVYTRNGKEKQFRISHKGGGWSPDYAMRTAPSGWDVRIDPCKGALMTNANPMLSSAYSMETADVR